MSFTESGSGADHSVIIGDAATAWIILAHTIVLVIVSLMPITFGMGLIYLAGAMAGGSFFIGRSIKLVRHPSPKAVMSNSYASFVQLGLLLLATIIDGSLNLRDIAAGLTEECLARFPVKSRQRSTALRYRCQVACPSTGITTARPTKNGTEPINRRLATTKPHITIVTGLARNTRTDV